MAKPALIVALLLLPAVAQAQTIPQLPLATIPLTGAELFPVVQNGLTKQVALSSIQPYIDLLTPVTPVVSSALEASHVIKASAGTLFSIYASNLTGGSPANLIVVNATAVPADGTVVPIICVPFNGGVAYASYALGPPAAFSTGITAIVSTATSCFTKTTGTDTAFISGMAK